MCIRFGRPRSSSPITSRSPDNFQTVRYMIRFVRFALGLPVVCSLLFWLSASSNVHAQGSAQAARIDTSKSTFGLFGDAAWNMHRANFQTLPDIPNCCPLFENGSGLGGSFGAFYDYDAFGDGHLGVPGGVR